MSSAPSGTGSASVATSGGNQPAKSSGGSGILKKIALVLVVLVATFVACVAVQPEDFRIVRSATMSAPPEAVFAQVNDFHNWEAWSPWLELDPKAKTTYEGPSSGKGAIFTWDGNDEVGAGGMTILESQPNDLIRIQLDFKKPMESTAMADFSFVPKGEQTVVTWRMSGKNNFIGRALCMVMNMDKMVGGQFDKGLAKMKTIVEAKPTP